MQWKPRSEQRCSNCYYRSDPQFGSTCQRMPPIQRSTQYNDYAVWPTVGIYGWCGEWRHDQTPPTDHNPDQP